jgi:hypothetical protein
VAPKMNISEPSRVSNFLFALLQSSPRRPLQPTTPAIIIHDSDSPSTSSSSLQMITLEPRLDHLEASTTTTQVEPDVIVGGANTPYTRKQLRLVNSLHDIG